MKLKGRIFVEQKPVTGTIEFDIERTLTRSWYGSFQMPPGLSLADVPGGVASLELEDSRREQMYLLGHDPSTGTVTFHLPDASLDESV